MVAPRQTQLADNRDGSVALMFALILVAVFGTAGAAIDTGRWLAAKSADSAALDAAVMAGARVLQTGGSAAEAKLAAQRYYESNQQANGGGNASAEFSAPDAMSVVGFAEGSVQTTLAGILGVTEMEYQLSSGAMIQAGGGSAGNMEIALMLDVTGSMCADGVGPCTGGPAGAASSTDPKMRALKDSAKELVDIVVWDDQSEYFSKVAVVPFSTRIRVAQNGQGAGIMNKLTNMPPTWNGWYKMCTSSSGGGGSENGGNWTCHAHEAQQVNAWKIMPCVTDRTGFEEFSDAAPGANAWLNAHGGNRSPFHWSSDDWAQSNRPLNLAER